jgi:4-amino-4-deoxy-L-arabinose transferase-like glycosyltransferase
MISWRQFPIPGLLILLVLLVFLWRLDGTKLWRDEATTACWAREILQSNHLPNVWNGRVLMVQAADGHDFNEHYLPAMQGWLQFYVTAIFFKLFGISTFTARLPFALLGIFGLWGFFRIGKMVFRDSRYGYWGILIASLTFAYIFYIRQCRYYAPALFFIIFMFQEIIHYLHQREYGANRLFYIKMGIYGILLYLSNYLTFATFWGALFMGLLFTAEKKVIVRFVILSVLLGVILSIEFYLMHWHFVSHAVGGQSLQIPDYLKILQKNLVHVNRILPFYVMLPLGVVIYFKEFRQHRELRHTLILVVCVIFFSYLLTAILAGESMFVRYYIQIIPATIILFLLYFHQLQTRWHPALAVLLLLAGLAWHNLSIFTDLNESVVQRQFLKQDHENGLLIDFLQKNCKPGEKVAFYRNVKGMAIFFYCPDLLWVGQLESQHPGNQKYRGKLPDYVFDDTPDVDWYILWDKRKFDMRKVAGYDLRWEYRFNRFKNWWKSRSQTLTYEVYKRPVNPENHF